MGKVKPRFSPFLFAQRRARHVQRRWNVCAWNRRWLRVVFVSTVSSNSSHRPRSSRSSWAHHVREEPPGDPSARPTPATRGSPRMGAWGLNRSKRRACSLRHDDRNRTLDSLCNSMSQVEAVREGRTKSAHLDEALDQFSRLVDDQFL